MEAMELRQSLEEIRKFLLPRWKEMRDNPNWEWSEYGATLDETCPSVDMCRFTTIFLHLISNGDVQICGGIGNVSSSPYDSEHGYRISDGKYAGHLWGVLDGKVIDITADQFGEEAIVICSESDLRYKPRVFKGRKFEDAEELLYTCPEVAQWAEDFREVMERRKNRGMDVPEIFSNEKPVECKAAPTMEMSL